MPSYDEGYEFMRQERDAADRRDVLAILGGISPRHDLTTPWKPFYRSENRNVVGTYRPLSDEIGLTHREERGAGDTLRHEYRHRAIREILGILGSMARGGEEEVVRFADRLYDKYPARGAVDADIAALSGVDAELMLTPQGVQRYRRLIELEAEAEKRLRQRGYPLETHR